MPLSYPPKRSSSIFASMRGDHAAFRINELDPVLDWHKEKLDFRVIGQMSLNGMTFTQIAPANDDAFRLELVSGPGAVDRPNNEDLISSFGLHGWHHVGFRVDDVDETVAELRRRDVDITLEPTDNADWEMRVAFITDPWGTRSNCFSIKVFSIRTIGVDT